MKCLKSKNIEQKVVPTHVCVFPEEDSSLKTHERLECPGIQFPDEPEKAFSRNIDPRKCCFLPAQKFNSLKRWFTVEKEKEEARQRHEAYFKYMSELSRKLIPDRELKEAKVKILEERGDRTQFEKKLADDCSQIKRDRQKERQVFIEKYRRTTLINRTPTLELTRALRHSEILNERQKQIELQKEIKTKENELEEKEYEQYKCQIKTAELQYLQKEEVQRSRKEQLGKFLLEQFQEKQEKKRTENEERTEQERTDLIRMAIEWEELQQYKRKQDYEKKLKALELQRQNLELVHKKRQQIKQKEEELGEMNKIINDVKTKRDCCVRRQIKKAIDDKIKQNEAFLVRYISQIPPVVPSEETVYQNGVRKNQKQFEKRKNEKNALLKRQAEDKIKDYQDSLRRQKQREEDEAEMKKMEMVERYKSTEAVNNYNKIAKQKEMEKKNIYRRDLLEQAAEQKSLREYENKMEDEFMLASYAKEDDHFFEYADEVLELARQKKWPLLPIENAIKQYKKRLPIHEKISRENEKSLQKSNNEEHKKTE